MTAIGTEADCIATHITGESGMAKNTERRQDPRHDEIARLAYHLYEARGRRDGHDIEDWVLAKGALARHYAYSDPGDFSQAGEIAARSDADEGFQTGYKAASVVDLLMNAPFAE